MKTIAVFLAALLLFLSAFSGIANISMKGNCCCSGMTPQGTCGHDQKSTKDCCSKGICGMMFSCSGCGFLVIQRVSILPVACYHKEMPAVPNVLGTLSGYSHSGWHPPQV